jgi:adenylate kinase
MSGGLSQAKKISAGAIILLGAPGAGKGTQARRIVAESDAVHISTGDVFRRHVERKTALGIKAAKAMNSGMLVADELVCNMLSEHIKQLDCRTCVILDGFPRSVFQAEWLDRFLPRHFRESDSSVHSGVHLVIQIKVAHEELLRRLRGRRFCPTCGHSYNIELQPSRTETICGFDGTKLERRVDDFDSVIHERLKAYAANTSPVAEYYRGKGQLQEIYGNCPADAINSEITRLLTPFRS